MATIYKKPSDLPEDSGEGAGKNFWNVANSPQLEELIVFQILHELNRTNSLELTDQQCRSKLAALEATAKVMYLPEMKSNTEASEGQTELHAQDEIPED